jgi:hypothetical protein
MLQLDCPDGQEKRPDTQGMHPDAIQSSRSFGISFQTLKQLATVWTLWQLRSDAETEIYT